MTEPELPPTLPSADMDRIAARHAAPPTPIYRDRTVWVGLGFVLAVIGLVAWWVASVSATARHAANDPCQPNDKRAACVAAARNAAGISQANQRLSSAGLPPVSTPAPVPAPTQLVAVPGPAGPEGPQGVEGPQGSPGAAGHPGASGEPGAVGPQGQKGETGASGQPGAPGANGADGAQGPAGPAGAQGPPGDPGPQGSTGPAGPPGPSCPDGYTPTPQPQLDGGSLVVCTSPPPTP